jgi:4-hydroxy-3-methylbut-2-enyl diphosphate reductase
VLIDGPDEIQPEWLAGKRCIGVTAGASAPEVLVAAVVERLQSLGGGATKERHGVWENIIFPLPIELER